MQNWSGQKVVVIGAARQGIALAGYLARQGAQVVLNDRRPCEQLAEAQAALGAVAEITWVCGSHPLSVLEGADLVCPSGGVPLDLPLVVEAQARGIPLSNDSQIFLEQAPCQVIGITGSAGKTTTTSMVGRMAAAALAEQAAGAFTRRAWVGGNIGAPLIAVVEQMGPQDLAVMELSSFQLELMTRSPQVAAVLNVTPNHLDRHGSMQAYTAAKAHILDFQQPGDAAVLGRDDPEAWGLAQRVVGDLYTFGLQEPPPLQAGAFLKGRDLYLQARQGDGAMAQFYLMGREAIQLRGEHNLLNVLAACAIAAAAGLPVEAMQAGLEGFRGVPHRLEFVRRWGQADWYNDSIATAPERAMAAIRSFDEPLVLLAGGRDKDLPWQDFAKLVQRRVRQLILFGEAAAKIEQALVEAGASAGAVGQVEIQHCQGLHDAVQTAAQVVQPGDVVLLSPGGTSFDEFIDFEERGRCFVQWVNELP